MLADLHLRFTSDLFDRAGSFWNASFAERDRARQLVELGDQHRLTNNFSRGMNRLAGRAPGSEVVAQQWLFFDPELVIGTGTLDLDDPLLRTDDGQRTAALSAKDVRYWGIPVEALLPLRIQSGYQTFTLGVDFFLSTNQKWLLFRRNPKDIAPDGRLLATTALRLNQTSWWSYLLRTETSELALPHVVGYIRNFQTPAQFRLALAAIAGLTLLPASGELKQKTTVGTRTSYRFEQFAVEVNYPHPALVVGKTYPKHTIVGDGVEVHQPDPGRPGTEWWRMVDWRGGLVLDPIIRNARLKLEDRLVPAYATGADDDGTLKSQTHVRLQLSDDFWSETTYWEETSAREKSAGQHLNELVGLDADDGAAFDALVTRTQEANRISRILGLPEEQPAVGSLANSKLVNPIDLMFRAVLGIKSYIVVLRPHHCPKPEALYDFLRRHLPMTGVPVIFDLAPDLPVETIGAVDSIGINDSVTVSNADEVPIEQSWSDRVPLEDFLDQALEAN